MMNKKLSMLALGVTLLLALSACGAEAKQSEPVEKNIVVSDSSNEESEIGLIETESPNTNTDVSVKESEGMSDKEL